MAVCGSRIKFQKKEKSTENRHSGIFEDAENTLQHLLRRLGNDSGRIVNKAP